MDQPADVDGALAEHLLAVARRARWTFPTSLGRPVGTEPPDWARTLLHQRRQLQAAAGWLVDHGQHAAAIELAAGTWRAWVLARDEAMGRSFLAGVLDAPDRHASTRFRALALYGDGLLAFRLGLADDSLARNEAALRAARTVGDREGEGLAHLGLSRIAASGRRAAETRAHAEAASRLLVELGIEYRQAPLHMRAQAARLAGDLEEAADLFGASVALNREIGDRGMVIVDLHNLGHVECRRGDVDRAEQCFDESAALAGETDDPHELALRSFNQASIALARHAVDRARSLLARARALLLEGGIELSDDDASEFDALERCLEE
jgi:tetratricopeptide (TPR) repeat protein